MKNKHVRTAWILSMVYCSKFYYSFMKQYENQVGKDKELKAFLAYGNLQSGIRYALKISLQDLTSVRCGIRNTMHWIWRG